MWFNASVVLNKPERDPRQLTIPGIDPATYEGGWGNLTKLVGQEGM